jgi:hypothetical protein
MIAAHTPDRANALRLLGRGALGDHAAKWISNFILQNYKSSYIIKK